MWAGAGTGAGAGAALRVVRRILATLCAATAVAAHAAGDTPDFVEVAPGVHVHAGRQQNWAPANRGDVANLGFVVGTRCVAVIDSGGTPALGVALRAAIARTTAVPVCYVINTHAHPDHILGNHAFAAARPAPRFVGHARLSAALTARGPFYLAALARDFGTAAPPELIVYPDIGVEHELEIDLGGRRLALRAWPTAHTDHDLTVLDRQTRTLFAGDLLFIGHLPVLDGRLLGWLEAMAALAQLDVARVVPGHGPVGSDWPGAMAPQLHYLETLRDQTRAAIRRGQTIGDAVKTIGTEAGAGWLLTDEFHPRNVTAAYAELEWED